MGETDAVDESAGTESSDSSTDDPRVESEAAPDAIGSGSGLADLGYRRTEAECHQRACEGTLWYDDHTLVCGRCSHTVDMDIRRRTIDVEDPWERYRNDPPTYHHSKRVRMPGGFLHAYDWVDSDDTDGPVGSLPGAKFYR